MTVLSARIAAQRSGFRLALEVAVEPGQTLAVVGSNGAGKSTLIGCLAGFVPLANGRIQLGERVLDDTATGEHVPVEKRRIGVVFQDYLLFPQLSVLENVAFGPRAAGMPRERSRRRAAEWLERFGLAAFAARRPAELSGGQAQRVALARALAVEPELLLLDEPLAALDAEVRDETRRDLAEHLAAYPGSAIVVTHSIDDVLALGSDVLVVEHGAVTQRGPVSELLRAPATPYARRLVG